MIEFLLWAGLTGGISAAVGATIVVVGRRREREARELALVEDLADRLAALDDVEDRLAQLSDRLDVAERTMHLPPER